MSRTERIDNIDPEAFREWLAERKVTLYTEDQLEEEFRDLLDLEPFTIGSLEYSTSHVFEQIDPIAYRCTLADYISDQTSEITETGLFGAPYLAEEYDEDDLVQEYLDEMEEEEEEEEEERD